MDNNHIILHVVDKILCAESTIALDGIGRQLKREVENKYEWTLNAELVDSLRALWKDRYGVICRPADCKT